MSCLRNPDHENAAQHLARHKALSAEDRAELGLRSDATIQEEAAALGGLKVEGRSFRHNARKFCQRTIGKRVREIQQIIANVTGITTARLSEYTDEIRLGAIWDGEWGTARACVETMAKLNGLWREKVALTDNDGTGPAVVRFICEDAPALPAS